MLAGDKKKISHAVPVAYQMIEGNLAWVDVDYAINKEGEVGFTASNYNNNYELTIDPAFTSADVAALADPAVLFQDLRGVECYGQPEKLVTCGKGDTIPILLFTKSEAPIYDVNLNVSFGEGFEYGGFALVQSGNATLDTVNADNPISPTFSISELSQAGGGVVVYIGVRAQCGVDYAEVLGDITFNLSYTSAGAPCSEAITPATSYASNVLSPIVKFNSSTLPKTVNFTNINTNTCITDSITNIVPGAGLTEILYGISNYGFAEGVTIAEIQVNGVTVPAAAYTIDPTTGEVKLNINSTILGGDGELVFNETARITVCFRSSGCIGATLSPIFTAQTACNGEVCSPALDIRDNHTLGEAYTFAPAPVITFTKIQDFALCSGTPAGNSPYIYEITMTSSITTPVAGDLYSLLHFIDACPSTILAIDTAYMLTGPAGSPIANSGLQLIYNTNNFRNLVNFRSLATDIDGANGLADIDGDGFFDDLPAGQSITFRVEFSPSCGSGSLSCSAGTTTPSCDFRDVWFATQRQCGKSAVVNTRLMINDGTPAITNASTGTFTGTTDQTIANATVNGYHMTPGFQLPAAGDSITTNFDYTISAADAVSCTGPGQIVVTLSSTSLIGIVPLELREFTIDGNPATLVKDTLDGTRRSLTFDGANIVTAGTHTFNFEVFYDSINCAPRQVIQVSAFVVQNCDACVCQLPRVCNSTTITFDPRSPVAGCNTGNSRSFVKRISTGYTGRDLANKIDYNTLTGPDARRILPGDTIEITGWIALPNAFELNNRTRNVSFTLNQAENGAASRPNLSHYLDVSLSRLQSIELKRAGSTFDMGTISITGDPASNSSQGSGITVGGINNTYDPSVVHPGITGTGINTLVYSNATGDYGDGAFFGVRYFNQEAGDQQGLDALYAAIPDGEFKDGDSICMTVRAVLKSVPPFLFNNNSSFSTPTPIDSSNFLFTIDARDWSDPATFTGASANLVSITPRIGEFVYYHDPKIASFPRVEWGADGCSPMLFNTFKILDPVPADWYINEFRPIMGIEELCMEIPMPYAYAGGATVTHHDQPAIPITPDSSISLTKIAIGTDTAYLPLGASGSLCFRDAEFIDGLRANDHLNYATDFDDELVGGTFPLMGVGLNSSGAATLDSLVFKVPLIRLCGTAPMGLPLVNRFSASYTYLPDYNTNNYLCNDGARILDCVNGTRYWPYDRPNNGNPHHLANKADSTAVEVGTTPTGSSFTTALSSVGTINDGPTTETNTLTISGLASAQPGYLVVTVQKAVDLQTIGGVAATLIGSTDSTDIYLHDLGTLATGPNLVDIVTDLEYCNPAEICIEVVVGCTPSAVAAELISKSGKTCSATKLCYKYNSGVPMLETRFNLTNNRPLCSTNDFSITYTNFGTSDLIAFEPTVYLPPGFVASMWSYTISGNASVAIDTPAINLVKTGVFGNAYEWPPATFPTLAAGQTMILTFKGMTTCESILGLPIATEVNSSAACDREFETDPILSAPIYADEGPEPEPTFSIQPSSLEISCAAEADFTITIINTGKAAADEGVVCLTLPAGLVVTESNIEVLAPSGATLEGFTPTPVGTAGVNQVCFNTPSTGVGGFFCFNLKFASNLACGPVDIRIDMLRTAPLVCSTDPPDTPPCEVKVNAAPAGFLNLMVIPAAGVVDPKVDLSCSTTPGKVNLNYSMDIKNPGATPFSDNVTFEFYYDIDGSGALEEDDVLVGTSVQAVSIPVDTFTLVEGMVEIAADSACPLILKVIVPGCTCSEVIVPLPEVLPDFIADLGNEVTLCPGEPYVLDLGTQCVTPTYKLIPATAGTITPVGSTLEIALNPGFGVGATPVLAVLTTSIGSCSNKSDTIDLYQLEDFDFGPYTFNVCKVGCQELDLGIPYSLSEDLKITISPSLYLDDPTSFRPVICDPASTTQYTITYSLNGQCVDEAIMLVVVAEEPKIVLNSTTACNSGVVLKDVATISPITLDGVWESAGDGVFTTGTVYSTATTYIPGALDKQLGSVLLTLRTDNPDGPCGKSVARETFRVIVTDCGTFPWNGGTAPAPPVAPTTPINNKNK